MTTRSNDGPGKTRHLNVFAHRCADAGMRVIYVNAEGQKMTRVFLAKSDVSQIKALYSGEDGETLAEAIRNNCSIWFPLNPGGNGNDA